MLTSHTFRNSMICAFAGFAIATAGGAIASDNVAAVDPSQMTELHYDKGAKGLTEAQCREIDDVVSKAQAKGEIDQVRVLAWADKEYPREGMKVAERDRKLASERSRAVRNYLKERYKISDVDTYNMAERPGSLQKVFKTSEYKVKTNAEMSGDAPTDDRLNLLRNNARASTTLVVVELK